MLSSVEQAFVGRDERRAPLKTPVWDWGYCAPRLWKALPNTTGSIQSLNVFKKKIKILLFKEAFLKLYFIFLAIGFLNIRPPRPNLQRTCPLLLFSIIIIIIVTLLLLLFLDLQGLQLGRSLVRLNFVEQFHDKCWYRDALCPNKISMKFFHSTCHLTQIAYLPSDTHHRYYLQTGSILDPLYSMRRCCVPYHPVQQKTLKYKKGLMIKFLIMQQVTESFRYYIDTLTSTGWGSGQIELLVSRKRGELRWIFRFSRCLRFYIENRFLRKGFCDFYQ